MMFGRAKEQKATSKEVKERRIRTLCLEHATGLPLAEWSSCELTFDEDCVTISSTGTVFRVAYEKVVDIQLKTSVEIQKAYVSSVGGAVGGAVLFGPLGAMVGGRAKEKKSKTIEDYLIITYTKGDAVDYLSFKIDSLDKTKTKALLQLYKPRFSGKTVTIDL